MRKRETSDAEENEDEKLQAAQMRAQLLVANKGLSEEELQKEHGLATFGSGQSTPVGESALL